MDPLWLIEKAYKKTRHHVGGEWQDQFRWCFGGDGGGGSGGGDSVDEGEPTSQEAQDEADEAAEAAASQSAEGRAGFNLSPQSGLPGPGETEDGLGFIGLEDPETGYIDPAGPLSSTANFSETFGVTPGQALAGLVDPSPIGIATTVLGLGPIGGVLASRGLSAISDVTGLTGAVEAETGVDITSGIAGQAGAYARGGVVPLQSGIGSLYGRK
jgi:hypothetical protein